MVDNNNGNELLQQLIGMLRQQNLNNDESGMEKVNSSLPKITKLTRQSNFDRWSVELELHFKTKGLWKHVKDGTNVN